MFDNLAEKLQTAFAKLRGNQKLTEADIDEAMRIVRTALLEADVNFRVVKSFVNRVKEQALGADVLDGLQPGQQVIKFVHDELVRTLSGIGPDESIEGAVAVPLNIQSRAMTVMMLCGLQGAGKTTLAGKLAKRLIGQGKQVMLAACDIQRPAAIQQLQVVGGQVGATVYTQPGMGPVDVAKHAVAFATEKRLDVVILDTAGRLHVDGSLMDELKAIHAATSPHETLLVVDAMTGQDAVNVATQFTDAIDITGFVLTKVDGDTRGGAAISLRAVAGKPIKLAGIGTKNVPSRWKRSCVKANSILRISLSKCSKCESWVPSSNC